MNAQMYVYIYTGIDFPGSSDGKESAYNAGDPGWISGCGRSPGEGNGSSLPYSCLENSLDRGAWWATVNGVTESDKTESLKHTHTHTRAPRRGWNKGSSWLEGAFLEWPDGCSRVCR